MKIVNFDSLVEGELFSVRILGNAYNLAHEGVHVINIAKVEGRERWDNESTIQLVKINMVAARIANVSKDTTYMFEGSTQVLIDGSRHPIKDPYYASDFSDALRLLTVKQVAVRRDSWPEGEMVFLEKGSHDFQQPSRGAKILDVPVELFENGDHGTTTRLPNFVHVFDCGRVRGWTPTTYDLLAHDWRAVKPKPENA